MYYVPSFAKTGRCAGFEYVAPRVEQPALEQWLARFYERQAKNVWRSYSLIVLELTQEGENVRLTERTLPATKAFPH